MVLLVGFRSVWPIYDHLHFYVDVDGCLICFLSKILVSYYVNPSDVHYSAQAVVDESSLGFCRIQEHIFYIRYNGLTG